MRAHSPRCLTTRSTRRILGRSLRSKPCGVPVSRALAGQHELAGCYASSPSRTKGGLLAEETIYAIVAGEIASRRMSPGVFAKAFSETEGDETRAIAMYIGYRVAQIKEEMLKEKRRLQDEREARRQAQVAEAKSRWARLDAEDQKIAEHEKRIKRKPSGT